MRVDAGLGPGGVMPSFPAAPCWGTRGGCGFLQPGRKEGQGWAEPAGMAMGPEGACETPAPCPQVTLGARSRAQL